MAVLCGMPTIQYSARSVGYLCDCRTSYNVFLKLNDLHSYTGWAKIGATLIFLNSSVEN